MSDIFVSYAREDRDRVSLLVQALEKKDWTVFWDRIIRPGEKYRDIIEAEIQACRCVLVVWTEQSVHSGWVQDEAQLGEKKLVPVLLDEVRLPLGFGTIHAANLVGWNGNESAPSFVRLISDIATKLDGPAPVKPPPHPPGPLSTQRPEILDKLISLITKLSALIVVTIVATVIITGIILWAFERLGIYFSALRVGLIVLVVVSVVVLAISTILSWFKRRRKNEHN
jgi:hypothetical protein